MGVKLLFDIVYNHCLGLCFMGAKHMYWSFGKKKKHMYLPYKFHHIKVWSRYRDKVMGTEDLPMESSLKNWLVNTCHV